MSKFMDFLKHCFSGFEKSLMPEFSCLACGRECKDTNTLICEDCKNVLIKISGYVCEKCGNPLPHGQRVCDECKTTEHIFDKARAVYIFDDLSSKIVYRLKYYGNKYTANHIAKLLISPMLEFGEINYLVPVPLHEQRLKERGYNQSELIANALGELTSIPVLTNVLIRKLNTETQTGKTKAERAANVVGAFAVLNKNAIKDKNIVLLDDVFTTGATVDECARVLKRAGAKKVYVLTLLKTVNANSHTKPIKRKRK